MTTAAGSDLRDFVLSHPWISFELNLNKLSSETWMRLGEAISKCDHIAGVPLQPGVAEQLHQVFLVKGVHATTQIEGNTLSEDEVERRIQGQLPLPESQEYLGREVDNVVEGLAQVLQELADGTHTDLTPARIAHFNGLVLRDLELEDGAQAGQVRRGSVVVGNVYRGAPAQDCQYLLQTLCTWIADLRETAPPAFKRPVLILSAIMAHLYLAWIHPFDDGNGRTARLIEYQLLIEAGVPSPAAHLLSNYYNRTRSRYYAVLRRTSQEPYPVHEFIAYAVTGFCEELRTQLEYIRGQQMRVAWVNFVHEQFHNRNTPAYRRQRELILCLPDQPTKSSAIRRLNPRMTELYVGKQQKTVTRDVNRLVELGLLDAGPDGIRPRVGRMAAFLPLRADLPTDAASR